MDMDMDMDTEWKCHVMCPYVVVIVMLLCA